MNKDELVTVNDLDEKVKKLIDHIDLGFEGIKRMNQEMLKYMEELNKPYIIYNKPEHLSLKEAMKYMNKSRHIINQWVKDGLLKPYPIGTASSIYYSRTELDNIKATWQSKSAKQEKTITLGKIA